MERFGALNVNSLVDKSTNGNERGQRKIHRMFQAVGSYFKREQRKLGLGGKSENSVARKVYLNPCSSWITFSLYQHYEMREKKKISGYAPCQYSFQTGVNCFHL